MLAVGTLAEQLEVFGEALTTEYLVTAYSGDSLVHLFLAQRANWPGSVCVRVCVKSKVKVKGT